MQYTPTMKMIICITKTNSIVLTSASIDSFSYTILQNWTASSIYANPLTSFNSCVYSSVGSKNYRIFCLTNLNDILKITAVYNNVTHNYTIFFGYFYNTSTQILKMFFCNGIFLFQDSTMRIRGS
jgi:hypothetical protein